MKKLMILLSVASFAGALFAAAPAPVLSAAQQAVALQKQGEAEYAKGATQADRAANYKAWRATNDATVFALGLPVIAEVKTLAPSTAGLIVRNYVNALTRETDPIQPLPGIPPVQDLAREYAPSLYISTFASAEEIAVTEVTTGNVHAFAKAAKRLENPSIRENAYIKVIGKGAIDKGYTQWFSKYLLTKTPAQELALLKAEARAVDKREAGPARDAWLQKLMTSIAVSEKAQP
ncbi:hypothetical protein [Geminisphaera colitermitum]|uniref:hypothetical protein n=1 Tax=Geminisphaera colitermitum TaxID=1148786 RepID=UPI000158CDC2|nr:hypothetical protein [Geminisphaera colitermitum]